MSKKQKSISSWEWTTLVGAWRYYSHRSTIASSMFPAELVERYFQCDYSIQDCDRIARQFVYTDFRSDGEMSWASLSSVDRDPWCKLFAFLKAYLKGWEVINGIECFYCEATKRHYPKDEYIKNPHIEGYINEDVACVKKTMKEQKNKPIKKAAIAFSLAISLTLSLGCSTCDCCRDRVFVPELTPNLELIDGWQPVGGCMAGHKSCVKYKSPDGVNTITRHVTLTGFQYETSTLLSTSGKPNQGKPDNCSHADFVVSPQCAIESLCQDPENKYGVIIYN